MRAPATSNRPKFLWSRPRCAAAVVSLAIAAVIAVGADRRQTEPAEGMSINAPAIDAPFESHALRLPASIRVCTFNIHGGRDAAGRFDLERTAGCLVGYDLVGLNEVHGAFPWQEGDQAQLLGNKLRLGWLFAPSERRWWNDDFGNGFLCSLPISGWRRIPLKGTRGKGYRTLVEAQVELGGRTLHTLVTHIDRVTDREEQLAAVIDAFLDLPEPAILMGDLNSTADDPLIQQLLNEPGVLDPLRESGAKSSRKRIDWIFTRGLRPVAAGITDTGASDHPAVWAELE